MTIKLDKLKSKAVSVFLVLWTFALWLLGGCASAGTGTGELESASQQNRSSGAENGSATSTRQALGPVHFDWKSDGPSVVRGQVRAILPTGKIFWGQFMQVTSETVETDYAPYWRGWNPGWYGWNTPWGTYGMGGDGYYQRFVTHYSGRVIATLRAQDGTRMRCRFVLASPSNGLAGSGQGDCQLSTGEQINDVALMEGQRQWK
ncbi:MAG: hypothetical protein IPJ88_07665 [Myxococcales bacterium]|nr:MAG: hypothetical protein IPJ88_07665 [Myxococcales bacterium]